MSVERTQRDEYIDPRCVRSREKVIAATVDLLQEECFDSVSIEAIAARSGVAKTTIYRNFESRESLCVEAIESLVQCPELADTGDVIADVAASLDELARTLRVGPMGTVLSSFFGAAERCEQAADLAREMGARRRTALLRRLRSAQAAGQLHVDIEVETLVSVLVGPLFSRRYVTRQPIGPAFVTSLIDTALAPLVRSAQLEHAGPV